MGKHSNASLDSEGRDMLYQYTYTCGLYCG